MLVLFLLLLLLANSSISLYEGSSELTASFAILVQPSQNPVKESIATSCVSEKTDSYCESFLYNQPSRKGDNRVWIFSSRFWIAASIVKWLCGCYWVASVMSDSLRLLALYSLPASSIPGVSAGKNTGVGFHTLLHGIFPIQGLNVHLFCLQHW